MKTFISLSIVILIALVSLWLQDYFQESPIIAPRKQEQFPDYFMDNFSITKMNPAGTTSYVMRAEKLEHFAGDNSTEIREPRVEFHDAGLIWTISARRARIEGDSDIIHLHDEVQIRRAGDSPRKHLAIDTSYLKVDPDNKIAETDQPAHIVAEGLDLNSHGMMFDGSRDILKLMSNVRGVYAPVK
jgi:lipopolysaccharide export system protein LptC